MKVIGTDELVPEDLLWCAYCCRYSMYPDRGGLSCTTCRSVVGRPVVDQFPLTQRPEDSAEIARLRNERDSAREAIKSLARVSREDCEANASRAEKAEARVMALEAEVARLERERDVIADYLRDIDADFRARRPGEREVLDALMAAPSVQCATCADFHRICRCHGEQPHPDCVDLIDCPNCGKDGAK